MGIACFPASLFLFNFKCAGSHDVPRRCRFFSPDGRYLITRYLHRWSIFIRCLRGPCSIRIREMRFNLKPRAWMEFLCTKKVGHPRPSRISTLAYTPIPPCSPSSSSFRGKFAWPRDWIRKFLPWNALNRTFAWYSGIESWKRGVFWFTRQFDDRQWHP